MLTGETDAANEVVAERAGDLIHALERSSVADPAKGLSAEELAGRVVRTLALPEIASLRPGLLHEFPVYATRTLDGDETAVTGIADALALTAEGRPLSSTGRRRESLP